MPFAFVPRKQQLSSNNYLLRKQLISLILIDLFQNSYNRYLLPVHETTSTVKKAIDLSDPHRSISKFTQRIPFANSWNSIYQLRRQLIPLIYDDLFQNPQLDSLCLLPTQQATNIEQQLRIKKAIDFSDPRRSVSESTTWRNCTSRSCSRSMLIASCPSSRTLWTTSKARRISTASSSFWAPSTPPSTATTRSTSASTPSAWWTYGKRS